MVFLTIFRVNLHLCMYLNSQVYHHQYNLSNIHRHNFLQCCCSLHLYHICQGFVRIHPHLKDYHFRKHQITQITPKTMLPVPQRVTDGKHSYSSGGLQISRLISLSVVNLPIFENDWLNTNGI